jgi:hypothetical protein
VSTEVCPFCDRPLDNPGAELAVKFARSMDKREIPSMNWERLADADPGSLFPTKEYGPIHVVAAHYDEEERNHGGDSEAFIILEIGGFLFRKNGTSDSYGETTWNGDFKPVMMKTKNVTVYE